MSAVLQRCLARLAGRPLEALLIGGSAGAVEALLRLVPALPARLPFPVVALVHLPPRGPNLLVDILGAAARLPVKEAESSEPLRPGAFYLAPAGYHLSVEPDRRFSLSQEPPVNYARPSIDLLFESAAEVYRAGLLAVLLTGANRDGARGLQRVRELGGAALVEDPATAKVAEMPRAALQLIEPDCLLSLDQLTGLFGALGAAGRRQHD